MSTERHVNPPLSSAGGKLDVRLDELRHVIQGDRGEVYSYVVRTIEQFGQQAEQTGCGPNFEGGVWTLCTCMHGMRASRPAAAWPGVWIAGFSRIGMAGRKQNLLVFLTRVAVAYESHAELWASLRPKARLSKLASGHRAGDLFKPIGVPVGADRFDPHRYEAPRIGQHLHYPSADKPEWKRDISYVDRVGRPAPLLVGDRAHTFVWREPTLAMSRVHGRNYRRWWEPGQLLQALVQGDPAAIRRRTTMRRQQVGTPCRGPLGRGPRDKT
jgi:hypothetical protein